MLYATHLEVDLAAIEHNLQQVRTLTPGAQVMVAVKANAYGHGAVPVARHLASRRLVDAFAVATTPEGIELRAAGIELPILRLSPAFDDELEAVVAHDLSLTVHDEATVDALADVADRAGRRHGVHLAIDTGMRRIGCEPEDAGMLAERIAGRASLRFDGIFTHLPTSDTPAGADFTSAQLARFASVVGQIQDARAAAGLPPVPFAHAANSGAILGYDLGPMTMVRPGIMAYGYYPDARATPRPVELRQALAWKSRVSHVKRVPAGQTVGYGRTWTAPVDSWIATVPVGYADGYSRLNSNRGRMLVGGRSHPVVGRICMDQTMLDLGPVTPAGPAPAAVGDEVVILGGQGDQFIGTDELADLMGTISYEVTCLITARVQRSYRLAVD